MSESSVPPHTAGIVLSIHTSKHYGRVLFYDFAGDAEYYSSHAAILENLASSRKGDNVFLLVIDMREEMAEIKKVLHYWFSFIQHQQFQRQKPRLIVNDYLTPRFHHVLLLRLVIKFTLLAHPPADKDSNVPLDLQRRCTVWKTGVHWLMEEGVECMVELVGANREVVVLTRSTKDGIENCAPVFNDIVSCVMEAKAEFCHSVRLEFFLLDSTSEADYHSADNLFAMRDVERVLTSADGRAEVIVSASGKRTMKFEKFLCLRNFTRWYSLFPMDLKSVLHCIKDVVRELYTLGLHLGLPDRILDPLLDALQVHYLTDNDMIKMRRPGGGEGVDELLPGPPMLVAPG